MLVLVLGGGPAREREQGLVLIVPGRGWPAVPARTARRRRRPCRRLLGGGWRAARRSIMETATRNAAGTAATIRPQAVGCAWERLAARLSSTPPASTTVGHDRRRVTVPCCLSRCRSRAAMTQVRSMQAAVAQAIGPCWAAVSRNWLSDTDWPNWLTSRNPGAGTPCSDVPGSRSRLRATAWPWPFCPGPAGLAAPAPQAARASSPARAAARTGSRSQLVRSRRQASSPAAYT